MNDERIEQLLRQVPAIKPPEGLLGKLKRDVRVPQMEMGRTSWTPAPSPFRRWLPALSFAVILMGCLVAIGVQTNLLSDLRRQNEELTATTQNLEALRAQNAEFQKLNRQNQDLERLRKDNAELEKLRGEVAQLQQELPDLAKLQAEHQALQASLAASPAASGGDANADFFGDAKARAERIQCVNNLKQLGLAVRIWAGDNEDTVPPDFLSMTNEMAYNLKLMQCPSDKSHSVTNWAQVAAGNVSYQFLVPGIKDSEDPSTVVFVCPIHHNISLLDGSVQQLSAEDMSNKLRVVNGRKIYVP